jgi:hypothetical protein
MIQPWFSLSMQMMILGFESQSVIYQRMLRLQAGGMLAEKEAARMVTEKMVAAASEAFSLGLAMATGRSPQSMMHSTVKSYRKRVASNRRRLRRKAK